MLVRIKSNVASFLVGALTICFSVKCLSRDEIGHLLKSPRERCLRWGNWQVLGQIYQLNGQETFCYRYLEGCKLRKQLDTKNHGIV